VTHADGMPVRPLTTDAVLMGMGERVDVLLDARRDGGRLVALALGKRGRAVASVRYAGERRRSPRGDDPVRIPRRLVTHADLVDEHEGETQPSGEVRTVPLDLTMGMSAYQWMIGARPFDRAEMLEIGRNERVRFVLRNRTMMPHPMHLHGHSFRALVAGASTRPSPLKDTVLVAPMEELSIEWIADNPGGWAFHHHVYHQEAGMMRHARVS
jgi:FtsP/CotA-like multicopper oxidase with cupredoxin domain